VACSPMDDCHLAGTCDPKTGMCSSVTAPDGTACGTTDMCTGAGTCKAGTCTPGKAVDCDDHDPCTTDTCDPMAGCKHTALPCSDGGGGSGTGGSPEVTPDGGTGASVNAGGGCKCEVAGMPTDARTAFVAVAGLAGLVARRRRRRRS